MGKDKQPTNGPYSWGNGPQPKPCSCKHAAKQLARGKVRLARRVFVLGWKARLGLV
jgi:hypothetical protein